MHISHCHSGHGHVCTHICPSDLHMKSGGLVAMAARSVGRGWPLGGCWDKAGRFNPPPPKFLSPHFSWNSIRLGPHFTDIETALQRQCSIILLFIISLNIINLPNVLAVCLRRKTLEMLPQTFNCSTVVLQWQS